MTSTMTASYPIARSVKEVADALRSADFARTRMSAARRQDVQLLSHRVDGDVVTLSWRSTTPVDDMPAWMKMRYRVSGPVAVRDERWTLGTDRIEGEFTQTNPEIDGTISGRHSIAPSGDALAWQIEAESSYNIPILGSKIERFSLDAMTTAFAAEAQTFQQA